MSGVLSYSLKLDGSGFVNPMRAAQGSLRGLLSTASQIGNVATGFGALQGILSGVVDILKSPITLAADMESLNAEFGVMLGSASKAKALLTDIQKFADLTPFDPAGLASSSKTLLQFGISGENVMPILKMLGDVAGGSQEKLNSLALVFGQVSSAGKLQGQDLLQLINAGFNPLQEISRTTGRSMADLRDSMEKGAIGADMVTGAFKSATSAGGLFFKNMETQSKTFNGVFSNFQAAFDELKRSLGTPIMLALKPALEEATNLLNAMIPLAKAWGEGLAGGIRTAMALLNGGQIRSLLTNAFEGIPGLILSGLLTAATTFPKLLKEELVGVFSSAMALLTQGQFWTGISSSAMSIMYAVKAVLLDAVAAAVDKLGPLLGAGADTSGLRQQAAEARMDEKGYGMSARNAFNAIDMDKVTAPMVEAANKARPILEGAFADLAASVKNNPHFEEFRRVWNKYAASSQAALKDSLGPTGNHLDMSDPKAWTWRDAKNKPIEPPGTPKETPREDGKRLDYGTMTWRDAKSGKPVDPPEQPKQEAAEKPPAPEPRGILSPPPELAGSLMTTAGGDSAAEEDEAGAVKDRPPTNDDRPPQTIAEIEADERSQGLPPSLHSYSLSMPKLQGTTSLFGTPDWMQGKNLGESASKALNRGGSSHVGGRGGDGSSNGLVVSLLRKWDTSGIKLFGGGEDRRGQGGTF